MFLFVLFFAPARLCRLLPQGRKKENGHLGFKGVIPCPPTSVNPRRINRKEKDENSEDMLGFGDEKVVSSDLMRIKLVFLARHLISIDSQGR